jgi:putative ubiquitin-RnfH superfamily antitoxin RatB of RatAB toxin-antitoxin module
MSEPEISISVVYALPEQQELVKLRVPPGTTVAEAVTLSGLSSRFPELATAPLQCAIFGRVVPLGQVVIDGDRVEVLRPLLIDPKESRRQAAARARNK